MQARLYPQDLLTRTGVVHEVSDILLPRSVNLTLGKLVKAGQGSTMTTIVTKAGFDWVLNGTAPPEGSKWAEEGLEGVSWTLLCPTDDAFKGINLTRLYSDVSSLESIVAQHLILGDPRSRSSILDENPIFNNRPLPFDETPTYSTLQSTSSNYGDLVFQRREDLGPSSYVVGIKGARGTDGQAYWARILSWGRSTTSGGGGVVQIDRLLMPYYPGWWFEYGAPIGVSIGGSILICFFFYVVSLVWKRDTAEATYEPVGGFGPDDES